MKEAGNYLIIWDRLGDYHRARVRALADRVGEERVFTADLGASDGLYGWENTDQSERHTVFSDKPVSEADFFTRIRTFRKTLKKNKIRYLALSGYGRTEYLAFLVLGKLWGCRITLFAESWYGGPSLKNRLKGWFLRQICDGFLVSGTRAREHFESCLGIPGKRIREGYSVVDNRHFDTRAAESREPVLLTVARFSPEKNLSLLVRAFLESELRDRYRLRMIGGGGEREQLTELAGDTSRIELVDWVPYTDLPGAYARASYFILPSNFEPWGLVVNEAMAAGLPVIVSDACGCQPDLVGDGNGFVFPAGDRAALTRILNGLLEMDDGTWQGMSDQSRGIIAGYRCEDWAKALLETFEDDQDR